MSILDPVWIKPASITKRTQDPLGLDRASNRLTSDMLTGITALTTRARYYSFYVWVIKNVNETEKFDRFDQFQNAFFDRERAYTMACIAHEQSDESQGSDHSNILGSQKGGPKWRASRAKLNMYGFRHLGNRLGGYGYYYQASIFNLGLTEQKQTRDVLTPLGNKLAEAFEKTVSQTKYYKNFISKDAVPKSVLSEYGSRCCLCLLSKRSSPDRDILRGILFGMNPEARGHEHHRNRQNTLALILYGIYILSQHSERAGTRTLLDIAFFRQFISKGNVVDCAFPSRLSRTLERWKMFRSHDYFSYACESLLHGFLATLDIHRTTGLSFSGFLDLVDRTKLIEELESSLHVKLDAKSSDEALLKDVLLKTISSATDQRPRKFDADVSRRFDSSCNLSSRINEQVLVKKLGGHLEAREFSLTKSTVWASMVLLLLYARLYWRSKTKDSPWKWLIRNSQSDLSPSYLVFHLEQKLSSPNYTMLDFISWIYSDYILTQAINIYNQKVGASLYSRPISWFHQDGEVYRIDRSYDPRFRNSRFSSCLNILDDLGLCEYTRNHYRLTRDGKDLLIRLEISVD